jgi:hypothetical protein
MRQCEAAGGVVRHTRPGPDPRPMSPFGGTATSTRRRCSLRAAAQRHPRLSLVAVCGRRDTLPVACESEEVCSDERTCGPGNVQLQELEATDRGWVAGRPCRRPGSCGQWSFSWRGGDRWLAACGRLGPRSRRRALRRLALPAPIGSACLEPGRAVHRPCSGARSTWNRRETSGEHLRVHPAGLPGKCMPSAPTTPVIFGSSSAPPFVRRGTFANAGAGDDCLPPARPELVRQRRSRESSAARSPTVT